ncbi:hypothetical protein [Halobacillus faecis]
MKNGRLKQQLSEFRGVCGLEFRKLYKKLISFVDEDKGYWDFHVVKGGILIFYRNLYRSEKRSFNRSINSFSFAVHINSYI